MTVSLYSWLCNQNSKEAEDNIDNKDYEESRIKEDKKFEKKGEKDSKETESLINRRTVKASDIGDISSTTSDEKAPAAEIAESNRNCDDVHDVITVGESNDTTDKGEEVLYRQTQSTSTGNVFNNTRVDTEEWSEQSQRPARAAQRPSRFRDTAFETRFRPEYRKKCFRISRGGRLTSERKCYELGRGDQAEKVDNIDDAQVPRTRQRHKSPGGKERQENVKARSSMREQYSTSLSQRARATQKSPSHQEWNAAGQRPFKSRIKLRKLSQPYDGRGFRTS